MSAIPLATSTSLLLPPFTTAHAAATDAAVQPPEAVT
jgi:hypothetical protein